MKRRKLIEIQQTDHTFAQLPILHGHKPQLTSREGVGIIIENISRKRMPRIRRKGITIGPGRGIILRLKKQFHIFRLESPESKHTHEFFKLR